MIKQCNNCREQFSASLRTAQFCSGRCQKAARRRYLAEASRNEWYSPPEVIEAARQAMGGIDLDPASCAVANQIVQADRFYSLKEDGLRQPWFGRVWLNPPYAKLAPRFVSRFAEQFRAGAVQQGVLLLGTHHETTDWFRALSRLGPIKCVPSRRLQFSGSRTRPMHGSVLLGIGVDVERFGAAFEPIGEIWYRSRAAA
jgi:ParB family chromosome partitioning protein